MAGSSNMSITRELFELTRSLEYVTYIPSINSRDRTGIAAFNETNFEGDYDVDTSFLYPKERCMNTYHVYEQFGRLADMDGTEVKKCMLHEVESQKKYYQAQGNVVLSLMQMTIEDWIAMHRHKRARADELCIFALRVLFNRHTVIFTSTRPWCTMDPLGHEHHTNFLSICDIHLLNLGDNMYINLKPHEEARIVSTLPLGVTMSIFNDTTQFHEISYEITPPVLDNFSPNDPEDDCTVLDYYPHRTPDTRNKNKNQNKNQISTCSLHVSDVTDSSFNINQPMNLSVSSDINVNDEVAPFVGDISCNNNDIECTENALDAKSYPHDTDAGVEANTDMICDNDLSLNEAATSNNITDNVTCNNILNKLCTDNMICNNADMEDGGKVTDVTFVVACDNDKASKEVGTLNNAIKDLNCNNIDNKLSMFNTLCNNEPAVDESSTDYKPVKWNDALLSYTYVHEDQCDISPLSLEDSPPNETCIQNTISDGEHMTSSNVELDSSRYNPDVSDISYDSDGSSHSCTTLSSSDDDIVPTLVRVSKDIMDEMGNKECWLLIPKLPQLTIDFWKNRDKKTIDVKPESKLDKDGDTIPGDVEQIVPTSPVGTKLNIDDDTDHKMDIDPTCSKPDNQIGPADSEYEDNSVINDKNPEVNSAELSEYDSPSSESDSLINPTKTKPVRRLRKRVNYADMCNDSGSSDEDSDRNQCKLNEKPLPGTGPSLSRLRAQELISNTRWN